MITHLQSIVTPYTVGAGGIVLSHGSGGLIQQIDPISPYGTNVAVRFNADGTVETGKSKDNAAIVWSSSGTWISGGTADSTYSVRVTGATVFTTKPVADDTWIDLGSNRTWLIFSSAEEIIDVTYTFEVRKTAGAPPGTGSGTYRFNIENIP